MGEPGLADDPRFVDSLSRYQNRRELDEVIARWTIEQDARETMNRLQEAGVPAGMVMDESDVHADPHVAERNFFQEVTHPEAGTHKNPTIGFKLQNTPYHIRRHAVLLGQDNEYVYKNVMGYSDEEYQRFIDMGHVGIFRSLARRAGLSREREIALHEALQRKAGTEVRELLNAWEVESACADALAALVDLDGDPTTLARAGRVLAHGGVEVERGLADLGALVRAVHARRPEVDLHVDLAELRGYRYHTGFVFAAFVPGYGREVARGGRYDEIGSVFGRARAATGFSADLKTLIALETSSGEPEREDVVSAPWSDEPGLLAAIRELRARGERVIHCLPGEAAHGFRRLQRLDGRWVVAGGAAVMSDPSPREEGNRR